MCIIVPNENLKRKREGTDPIETVNKKSDDQFIKDHLCPSDSYPTSWTHPVTRKIYSISLVGAPNMLPADLQACYDLVEESSRADYEASPSTGWKPAKKMAEMKSRELRYTMVKDAEEGATGTVEGFTSIMPTYEEGEPVLYLYEIHLKPELQGTGLGKLLMSFSETVAANTPPIRKVMLTCFLSNEKAMSFYRRNGFTTDPISPRPKKLRYGRKYIPDYAIMSKRVGSSVKSSTEVESKGAD
ncbi:acyl-CoA N-acyltransferase [Poronia punctata]|nr:acyl-CoA N-acyltransferase [Poronia punctata]